jgi:hypothetical protein
MLLNIQDTGWRKLHNEELNNLWMRWAGMQPEWARRGIHKGYWWKGQKERDH